VYNIERLDSGVPPSNRAQTPENPDLRRPEEDAACKTVAMSAAPDELQTSTYPAERLGAIPGGAADLGPISPELALIDTDLARRARELLPEPGEFWRARATPPPAPPVEEPVAAPPPARAIEPPRGRRWARTLVFAAVVFAAGAASGATVAPERTVPFGTALGFRAAAPATLSPPAQHPLDMRTTRRPRKVARVATRPGRKSAAGVHRHQARAVWASNVLGVVTRISRGHVVLLWGRRQSSGRVVVLRARNRGPSRVVYRGRGTRFEDSSIHACTTYRYTLVRYDRRGRRSTGVSSSVVTPGCT
jgi:hypothetical protein